MIQTLLGGITPQEFLTKYWHKRPLLVRQAVPGFQGLASPTEIRQLACSEEAESRLIQRDAQGAWQLTHGPLSKRQFPKSGPWTVLVQGLNLLRDDADALLRRFSFLPYARLDDLMVSYATDGGGVGPHFDSYDVFLLQGQGKRRWRIGAQRDLSLVEDAPLKILKHFKPSQEWVLEPGDMLYLPPRYAHDGVAIGECTTYSIGFRAPSARELVTEFLYFLEQKIQPTGMYADPDLALSKHPGKIPEQMIDRVSAMLESIRWSRQDVGHFLGEYLSEPKPQVIFDSPTPALSLHAFRKAASQHGLILDRRSQLLYRRKDVYMNGERVADRADLKTLRTLANCRRLPPTADLDQETLSLFHAWYEDGFMQIANE